MNIPLWAWGLFWMAVASIGGCITAVVLVRLGWLS